MSTAIEIARREQLAEYAAACAMRTAALARRIGSPVEIELVFDALNTESVTRYDSVRSRILGEQSAAATHVQSRDALRAQYESQGASAAELNRRAKLAIGELRPQFPRLFALYDRQLQIQRELYL